jgi:hypothetical protein
MSPEADLRPRLSMHTYNRRIEKTSGQAAQLNILNNMIHGENLSSPSDKPEFVAQNFFEIPASADSRTVNDDLRFSLFLLNFFLLYTSCAASFFQIIWRSECAIARTPESWRRSLSWMDDMIR